MGKSCYMFSAHPSLAVTFGGKFDVDVIIPSTSVGKCMEHGRMAYYVRIARE